MKSRSLVKGDYATGSGWGGHNVPRLYQITRVEPSAVQYKSLETVSLIAKYAHMEDLVPIVVTMAGVVKI
jgi:hypothetical protein